MSLRRKTYVLLAARVVFNACGDISLARGMKQIGAISLASPSFIAREYLHVISNGMIWLGMGFLLAFFVCHLLLYSWADFSYVMPTTSANFVLVPVLGLFLLHENVSLTRWAGVVIVFLGVMLIGWSHPDTREAT